MLTDYFTGLWFALQVRTRWEKSVAYLLSDKGYEVFAPQYPRPFRSGYSLQTTCRPLFPGYLFIRFDHTVSPLILNTRGVIRIVGNGKKPVPIPQDEIESLRMLVRSDASITPWPFLKAGQKIRIIGGPLEGIDGILLRDRGKGRLIVSIDLLERSVSAEVDLSAVIVAVSGAPHGASELRPKAMLSGGTSPSWDPL
jgi:transcription antitermination factor NusG